MRSAGRYRPAAFELLDFATRKGSRVCGITQDHTYLLINDPDDPLVAAQGNILEGGPQFPGWKIWGNYGSLIGFDQPVGFGNLNGANPITNNFLGSESGQSACAEIPELMSLVQVYDLGPEVTYHPLGWFNCNSFTYTLLDDIGLSMSFGLPINWVPGGSNCARSCVRLEPMTGLIWMALPLLVAFLSSHHVARGEDALYIPAATIQGKLTAFPASGAPIAIIAPGAPLGWVENGRLVLSAGGTRGIEKIDLESGKTSLIDGSEALWGITDLAVTQSIDRIVACSRLGDFRKSQWAIVSFSLANRAIKPFVPYPLDEARWQGVTLSPDGAHALSVLRSMKVPPPDRDHRTELKLIDLETAAVKSLGFNFLSAAWSPDGQWIAAGRSAGGISYLVLLDPVHFKVKRSLGRILDAHINWSPDSRKLIVTKSLAACGPYFGTLFSVDLKTGKAQEIKSSHCLLGAQESVGWVSNDVYKTAVARAIAN